MICDPTASRVPEADLARVVEWAGSSHQWWRGRARADASPAARSETAGSRPACALAPAVRLQAFCASRSTGRPPSRRSSSQCRDELSHWLGPHDRRSRARAGRCAESRHCASTAPASAKAGTIFAPDEPPLCSEAAEASLILRRRLARGPRLRDADCRRRLQRRLYGVSRHTYRYAHQRAPSSSTCSVSAWSPSVGYELERWKSLRRAEVNSTEDRDATAVRICSRSSRHRHARRRWLACAAPGAVVKSAVRRGRLHVNGGVGQDVRSWFRNISDRGCEIMLVYSAGDTGLVEFQHWTGPMGSYVTRLPGISLRLIDNADHNLTSPDARAAPSAASDRLLGGEGSESLRARLCAGAAALSCPIRDAGSGLSDVEIRLKPRNKGRRHEA